MRRISFDELEAKLADPDLPDAQIRPYLRGVAEASAPFDPIVQPDPDRVELRPLDAVRAQGLHLLGWANSWARWRRQQRCLRRLERGESLPLLVSEGDSWFQFPLLLDDTIDQLAERYLIWSLDAAGDTLAHMTGTDAEYASAFLDPRLADRVRGLLLSAGGNDIIGTETDAEGREVSVLASILRPRTPGRDTAWHVDTEGLARRLAEIETGYRRVLETVAAIRPGAFVVCHGYARAVPAFDGDPRRPSWTRHGGWLRRPLESRGFRDPQEQRAIVALLIDRLHDLLARLCGGNRAGGAYPFAYLVDCRPLLDERDWADEIHPTDAAGRGFAKVGWAFERVIEEALLAHPVPARIAALPTGLRLRRRTRGTAGRPTAPTPARIGEA